jgi:hypothetical protein
MYYKLLKQILLKVLVELKNNRCHFMNVRPHSITIILHINEVTNDNGGISFRVPGEWSDTFSRHSVDVSQSRMDPLIRYQALDDNKTLFV